MGYLGMTGLSGMSGMSGIGGGSSPPTINSSASFSVVEGATAVGTVTATSGQTPYVFSISGGADAALFSINSSTGVLAFLVAPDYGAPGDSGANNVYDIVVRVASSGGAYAEQNVAITVTPAFLLRLISSRGTFQDVLQTTPSGVGDRIRSANNQGTASVVAVAPGDAASPTRVANGFAFDGTKYMDLGVNGEIQPATLRVSCSVRRTGTILGPSAVVLWAKPNADFAGSGWYLDFVGGTGIFLVTNGSGNYFAVLTDPNTLFPLNTVTQFIATFNPAGSPKGVVTIGGVGQSVTEVGTLAISSMPADNKYFGINSPGYGNGYLNNCTIENFIIHSALP